jgi:hypothetical protein
MKKLKIILIVVGFICWGIVFVNLAMADSVKVCREKCKAQVFNIIQCIEEEKSYWDTDVKLSDYHYRQICLELIRNSKQECYDQCKEK